LNALPFRFTARAVGRFVVTFAVLYGAAFALYWTTPLFGTVQRLFIGTSTAVLHVTAPAVSYQMHLDKRLIHVTAVAPGVHRSFHIMGLYGTNLALFVALVLASPGLTWRTRAASLAAGSGLIVVINTLVMCGTIWTFQARYTELQPLVPSGAVFQLARLAFQFSPTGGLYMLPVLLWGFVLLSPLVARRVPG
jgi:putative flippase GtrA